MGSKHGHAGEDDEARPAHSPEEKLLGKVEILKYEATLDAHNDDDLAAIES